MGAVGLSVWLLDTTPDAKKAEAAQSYLRANQHELSQDLALGAGTSISDLAAAAEVRSENLTRFGAVLRAHREELLARIPGAVRDPTLALRLLARIGELARTDPALYADYLRFLARHQQEG